MKKADKMFGRLGYTGVDSNAYVIAYEKPIEEFGYTKVIEFIYKRSGEHIVCSYQKGVNGDGFNNSVGLTIPEIKAIRRQLKELKW